MTDDQKRIERMRGLLLEMKAAMLGYPMSMRALTSSALLQAINRELEDKHIHAYHEDLDGRRTCRCGHERPA